jgi:hypothetical protein
VDDEHADWEVSQRTVVNTPGNPTNRGFPVRKERKKQLLVCREFQTG